MFLRQNIEIKTLVNEMLDQLPKKMWTSKTTTFLDPCMGSGQFVREIERRLREQGHSVQNIRRRVFGNATARGPILWAQQINKLVGSYTKAPLLKDLHMKFDVIVGNPPFQSLRGEKNNRRWKLWTAFVDHAINHCVEGGHIAFISPIGWLSPSKIFNLMIAKNLIYVTTDIKKYFPGVGSTFSAWVMKNEPGNGKICIDGQMVDTDTLGLVPLDRSNTGLTILNKFFSCEEKLKFHCICDHHRQKQKKDPTLFGKKSSKYQYAMLHTPNQTLWSRTPSPIQNEKKVIIFLSGYLTPTYDTTSGTTQGAYFKLVKSRREGKNLINLINSKLFKYALQVTKYSGFNLPTVFNKLPFLDYRETWTDEEIYDYFGLTEAERKHVEAYIA